MKTRIPGTFLGEESSSSRKRSRRDRDDDEGDVNREGETEMPTPGKAQHNLLVICYTDSSRLISGNDETQGLFPAQSANFDSRPDFGFHVSTCKPEHSITIFYDGTT